MYATFPQFQQLMVIVMLATSKVNMYRTILTNQAWSINDLLCGQKSTKTYLIFLWEHNTILGNQSEHRIQLQNHFGLMLRKFCTNGLLESCANEKKGLKKF